MRQKNAAYGNGGLAQSMVNKNRLKYENSRKEIERAKLAGLAQLESDYRDQNIKLGDDYTGKVKTARSKSASGGKTVAIQIGDNKTVHRGSESQALESAIQELQLMGFTRAQAKEYLLAQL